jgi:hypothetical protein
MKAVHKKQEHLVSFSPIAKVAKPCLRRDHQVVNSLVKLNYG